MSLPHPHDNLTPFLTALRAGRCRCAYDGDALVLRCEAGDGTTSEYVVELGPLEQPVQNPVSDSLNTPR